MKVNIGQGPNILWSHRWKSPDGTPPPHVRIVALATKPDADVIVIQRPGRRWWAEVIPYLQQVGIRVVVDVDDRFDQIHTQHIGNKAYDPRYSDWNNHEWINLACMSADIVTTTTKSLLQRYGHGHGIVLPNLVPERYLSIARNPIPHTIGWSGQVGTHPTDLQETGGSIARALATDEQWGFYTVGTGDGVKDALGLAHETGTSGGWVPFSEYADCLSKAELGIVPLADTAFNAGKSSLKMSEFAALGIPVVGSPIPDNIRLNKLGVGFIASTPNQWFKRLKALMANEQFRLDCGERNREVMRSQTYEQHCERWLMAWTGSKALMKAAQ